MRNIDFISVIFILLPSSRPVATFVSWKFQQRSSVAGIGCLAEECRNDVVLQETLRLFGSVETKRDKRTGEYFIIEPNVGRPTGRSPTAEAGG